MNVLVRNLPRTFTEKELFDLFTPFGKISALNIVMDKVSGLSKGFGFVDMPDDVEARAAIQALNNRVMDNLRLRVKTTRKPYQPEKPAPPQ